MSFEVEWEPRGVVKRYFGRVTGEEVFAAGIQSQGDHRFDQNRYAINDFLDCTEFVFDQKVLEELAAFAGAAELSNPNIRIAIVATLPAVVAATTQYIGLPLQRYPTRLFATRAAARAWIAEGSQAPSDKPVRP
jgi:hypothetical protein